MPRRARTPRQRHGRGVEDHALVAVQRRRVGVAARAAGQHDRLREVGAGEDLRGRRAHVVRAILEGVAFSLRDTFEIFKEMKVPVSEIKLGGGGARSALWRQIQADVFGQDVVTINAEQGPAYGVALLAAVGSGAYKNIEEACSATIRVVSRTSAT